MILNDYNGNMGCIAIQGILGVEVVVFLQVCRKSVEIQVDITSTTFLTHSRCSSQLIKSGSLFGVCLSLSKYQTTCFCVLEM